MSLNIKDESVHAAVRELAALSGVSQTQAVREAVDERLSRLKRRDPRRAERLLAIGRDCAARLDSATLALDHGELLYDDAGLPR